MEEARAVLARLDRIDRLERLHAPAEILLDELRALVVEAEAWSRREDAGNEAVDALREAFARDRVEVTAG